MAWGIFPSLFLLPSLSRALGKGKRGSVVRRERESPFLSHPSSLPLFLSGGGALLLLLPFVVGGGRRHSFRSLPPSFRRLFPLPPPTFFHLLEGRCLVRAHRVSPSAGDIREEFSPKRHGQVPARKGEKFFRGDKKKKKGKQGTRRKVRFSTLDKPLENRRPLETGNQKQKPPPFSLGIVIEKDLCFPSLLLLFPAEKRRKGQLLYIAPGKGGERREGFRGKKKDTQRISLTRARFVSSRFLFLRRGRGGKWGLQRGPIGLTHSQMT